MKRQADRITKPARNNPSIRLSYAEISLVLSRGFEPRPFRLEDGCPKRVSELETEVARLKNWDADKARYQLAEIATGVVALSIKDAMRNGEPFHRICANCAAGGKKSYLQQHIRGSSYDEFRCNECKEEFGIHKDTGRVGLAGYGGRDPDDMP
jgi:hypothetical protein